MNAPPVLVAELTQSFLTVGHGWVQRATMDGDEPAVPPETPTPYSGTRTLQLQSAPLKLNLAVVALYAADVMVAAHVYFKSQQFKTGDAGLLAAIAGLPHLGDALASELVDLIRVGPGEAP